MSIFRLVYQRSKRRAHKAIADDIEKLEKKHTNHIEHCRDQLEERLTGDHKTSTIHEFSSGYANRSSSIRIPKSGGLKGLSLYRRQGVNADPYIVVALLVSAICGIKM